MATRQNPDWVLLQLVNSITNQSVPSKGGPAAMTDCGRTLGKAYVKSRSVVKSDHTCGTLCIV